MSSIYEVEDKDNYYTQPCLHCERCGDDEIEPHEYHETPDKCAVCHNRNCLNSFDEEDIELDDQGESLTRFPYMSEISEIQSRAIHFLKACPLIVNSVVNEINRMTSSCNS